MSLPVYDLKDEFYKHYDDLLEHYIDKDGENDL